MRLRCFNCNKSVSNEVLEDITIRAVLYCPECIPIVIPDLDELRAAMIVYDTTNGEGLSRDEDTSFLLTVLKAARKLLNNEKEKSNDERFESNRGMDSSYK